MGSGSLERGPASYCKCKTLVKCWKHLRCFYGTCSTSAKPGDFISGSERQKTGQNVAGCRESGAWGQGSVPRLHSYEEGGGKANTLQWTGETRDCPRKSRAPRNSSDLLSEAIPRSEEVVTRHWGYHSHRPFQPTF